MSNIMIPLDQIRQSGVHVRGVDKKCAEYLSIKALIETEGYLPSQPILVAERKDTVTGATYYEIMDGLHRWTACGELGFKEIPAVVHEFKGTTDEEQATELLFLQMALNSNRKANKASEETAQFQRIMAINPTMTIDDVARRCGQSREYVSNRLDLGKLDPAIMKLVDEKVIPLMNAYALSKLTPEHQKEFAEVAVVEDTSKFGAMVKQKLSEIAAAKRAGRGNGPSEWTPVPHLRNIAAVKTELENGHGYNICATQESLQSAKDGWDAACRWLLHLDPQSVAESKAKYEEKQKKMQTAKAERLAAEAVEKQKKADELRKQLASSPVNA